MKRRTTNGEYINATGLKLSIWVKLLRRWSTVPDSPERELAIAVVAGAIVGQGEDLIVGDEPKIMRDWRFDSGTTPWIHMLHIDPDELFGCVELCWAIGAVHDPNHL